MRTVADLGREIVDNFDFLLRTFPQLPDFSTVNMHCYYN